MKQHAPQQGDCEALLRTVTQDLPGPFYRCDPDGRLVFVNDACCDCFGKSREQLIGRDLFELIPGPERAAVRDRLHRLRAEDPAVSQEHTVIAADGSARSLRWHNRAICDAHGEVVTLQGYGEDVTALRQAELKLRLVTETIDDVFWMSTPGIEKIIYVSPAYETLWERSCESLYQSPKSFLDAVHPDDRDGFIRTVSESHRHCRPYSYDYRIVKRNGDIRWIRERGFPVNRELEGSRVMLGVCTDMTEIFLAREQLTESNRRMSALMSNLPGMAYRCLNDTNWTVTFVSEGCEELTGYPADALLDNHSVSYAQLIHADDRERVWREVQAALEEGGRFELSYRLINPAGEEKWVCEHGVPVYAENGELLALEGVILDDDERKRAEFSLQENERKYRALFDNAPLSYQSLDRNGTIIDVNPAWLTTLGYDRDEVIGRYFGDFMPPEWRDRFRQRFSEFRKNGRVSGVHLCLKHRQGHYLDVLFEGCIDYTLAGDFRQTYCVFQDITERRKAENRLAESESRFRAFFDNAGVGIAEIETASGRFLCANRRFFEMFGYSAAEMASLDFRRLTYDDDLQRNLDNLDRLVAGEIDSFSMDKRCTRKDGSQIWTNVAVTPLWSPGETSGHHIAVVEDIDARKRAEESARTASEETALMLAKSDEVQRALLSVIEDERQGQQALMKSRERYRSVVSSIKEVIFQTDTDGRWLFLNPAWTEVTGYDVDESLGTPFLDCLHPDERQRIEALFASLISQEKDDAHQEVRYLHKTGGIRWIEADARTSVNDDGVIAGVSGTLNDITERKHMEDRLRKLAQAVEQSPENIVITNLDAEIEYVNQAFLDTTGYGLEDVIGANTKILQSGKTPRESYRRMWASLSKGEQWKGEFVNRRKNGDEYIEFARIAPLRGPDGTVTHYVAVKEDITEKKRVASELDEHRHHLEDLVEKRTAELADARQRAEAANQAKSSFLANMSHEIRTPMNAIIGLTHLLQNAGPPPEQSMRLSKIDAAAGHLLAIINDILDISKIEAGKLVLEQSDFHLDAIFDHIRSLLREQARGKGLDLEIERNAVPQWLRGDPTRLRQALLNYAANAIKFTEQGTIHLRSNLLASNDDDLLVRFEVQDTGIGIEQDKLSHLFQTFEQADASTTRKRGGTGLGLAITKHLARLMGGEVGAQSEPGQGSTFWFTAKLQRGRGIRQEPALMLATGAETALRNCCSGSRILLAEDNVINREVALELLNGAGMEVDTAENGREAVEMVRAGEYDLVLMDVQMPEMDGLEATQLIRTMDNRGAIPVLAMTANIFEDDRRACSEAGMNDFIAKPVNP
ncbi:MAG: PAS domain S-box protein, partial [Gammaproteobacteria bacterium]|nr:PAS domain S-box protein [Gammaproteobacteria bacterium]